VSAQDLIDKYLVDRDRKGSISSSVEENPQPSLRVYEQSREVPQVYSEYGTLAQLAKYPHLTHEENMSLAIAIEAGVFADEQMGKEGNPAALSEALEQVVQTGKLAFEKLYRSNLRLVLKVASESSQGIPLDDRFQAGCEGLNRAIQGWDYRLGYTFATYATNWIRQSISREIANFRSVIRLPVHLYEEISWNDEEQKMLVDPNSNLEKNAVLARQVEGMFNHRIPINAISDKAHIDWHTVSRSQSLEDVEFSVDFQRLRAMFDMCLDDRSRYVVAARCGLVTGDAMTLEEVGQSLGVTRERARQIEKQSLMVLKAELSEFAQDLYEYLSTT